MKIHTIHKRVNRSRVRRLSFPAIKVSYNNKHFYLALIRGKALFACARVSRADEDPNKGYQRLLKASRAKVIAEYFNTGNVIPGSIILSAQPEASLNFNQAKSEISFLASEGAFLVIDGQHRLYGAHEATVEVQLPVCIFEGLNTAQEVQYFLDINGTQRGVPRTLQLEIVKFSAPEDSEDAVRVKLFNELNSNPESPLCNKMSPTKSVIGKLSHVPFKAAIDPILRNPQFRRSTFENKTKLLINFLTAAEAAMAEAGRPEKMTNAAFFQSLFVGFDSIMNYTRLHYGNLKEESFRAALAPLSQIDWDRHSGTNKAAIQNLAKEILSLILGSEGLSDEMLQ
ncbi:MAG: DGQHR domain-containing protein [Kiritimatiellae bacterium]|nr:DGQHR domain-containing protein [Kiritimatiellia bacterium]MDD5519510.1 DGQHR domain-containing protein [Kiritimatiellia bacterium]